MHTNTHTLTHKHGCWSSNLLCYRADGTAPITITGPDLHHKRKEGPNPSGPVLWSETHWWVKQAEGRTEETTLTLTFRLGVVGRGALLLVQQTLWAQRGFGVQVFLVWTWLLHFWQSTGQILSRKQGVLTWEEWEPGQDKTHCGKDSDHDESIFTSLVWWTWCVPSDSSPPLYQSPEARSQEQHWAQHWPFHAPAKHHHTHVP